jgi:DNA-directed RNA polymerase specialized sigma24 family protein
VDAASAGDGEAMAEALWKSGLPQSIAYSIRRQHTVIAEFSDVEFIVADAVAELYRKVKKGDRIGNPGALLRTIAGRRAITYAQMLWKQRAQPLDEHIDWITSGAGDQTARTESQEDARKEAIRLLRGYVRRMGAGRSVTMLWETLVDAIEAEQHLNRADLADRLHISKAHVGVLRHRGKREIEAMLRADGRTEAADALHELFSDSNDLTDEVSESARDDEDDDDEAEANELGGLERHGN